MTVASDLVGAPLRVLGVIASSDIGGAERQFVTLLKGLDRRRFEAWVICHGSGPMLDEYGQVAAAARSMDLLNLFNPKTVIALAKLMRQLGCQIVHTHLWTADALGGLAATLARVPVRVATVHGGYFQWVDEQGVRRARKAALSGAYRSVYRLFDRVIAVSSTVAEDLACRRGLRVPRGRTVVVFNGLDFSGIGGSSKTVGRADLGIVPGIPVVAAVANFFPYKGHRWLVEAIPDVVARYPEATFLLVGDGPLAPAIRRLADERGVGRHLRFIGSRRDALDLIALSDVAVLPSVAAEGLGYVVLEALALGKPVVATRVGGIPDIIEHEKTGLLVPPRDPRALAEAICCLLGDLPLARALGEAGREVVLSRFSHETMVHETERLYLDLAIAKGVIGPA